MQCRIVYDNVLDVCAGVSGVGSSLDAIQQALTSFDDIGKWLFKRIRLAGKSRGS